MAELNLEDDLTQLCNRRGFVQILEAEMYRSGRFKEPLSMLMMKVVFAAANDNPDADAKDRILREICRCLFSDIRRCDTFGRLDINTFALLMPRTSPEKARRVRDRLRRILAERRFSSDGWNADVALEPVDLGSEKNLSASELLERVLTRMPANNDPSSFSSA
jgi:diguanylate cyclase (GGDEF)-like protein